MTASGVRGIDLFKIAGRSISGWIPHFTSKHMEQVAADLPMAQIFSKQENTS
jgi:hypothetical protein